MNMRSKWSGWAWAAALAASGAMAQEAKEEKTVGSVTLDAASAYVFRGVTLNKGFVLQPSLSVEALPGLTLGVWANYDVDDNDGALKQRQFSEVDLTASYELDLEAVTLSLGYAEYTYPGADAKADREISLSLALPMPLSPSLTAYYGVGGAVKKNAYVEAAVGHDVELAEDLSLSLGATVGYAIPDEGDSGFSNYTVSAAIGFLKYFTAKLAYIGQLDDSVLTDAQYVREVVFTLSASASF